MQLSANCPKCGGKAHLDASACDPAVDTSAGLEGVPLPQLPLQRMPWLHLWAACAMPTQADVFLVSFFLDAVAGKDLSLSHAGVK